MSPFPSSQEQRSEEALFLESLNVPETRRGAWLTEACAGDGALLERMKLLLGAHEAEDFMAAPVMHPAGTGREGQTDAGRGGEMAGYRVGAYELLEPLGAGAFGTVWMAEQTVPLKRTVALKILKPGMDTREVVARFGQERQVLALMEHPNIARIFDAGTTPGGRAFIAMELVRGTTVTRFCDGQGLNPRARLELFRQVCLAVQHAHLKGIIHRDLKPSNVLVTETDGKPVAKVIDFGVAKAVEGPPEDFPLFTQAGDMVGTPLYMSPEQAAGGGGAGTGGGADTRSDIYSLGVLLYELLTGGTPIPQATLAEKGRDEVRRLIREADPLRPSQRVRALSGDALTVVARQRLTEPSRLPSLLRGELDWIVMKCLEKDPARRYQTVNALALDLSRHLRGEPVLARPPGRLYVLGKTVRRHRGLFAAVAAVGLTLILGTIVSASLALKFRQSERVQGQLRREAENFSRESLLRAYEADMTAAALLHARGENGDAAQLLDRYWPGPEGEDVRGFEWRYLHNQVRGDQARTLEGHDTMVSSVDFSPDGRLLASGDISGQVNIWETETGRLLATPRSAGSRVVGLSFSHDGKWLATGSATLLRMYSVPGFQLEKTLKFPPVRPLFSPTEPLLALGVDDNRWYGTEGEVRLWRYESDPDGKQQRILPEAGTRMAFSADGLGLATGVGLKHRGRVWSLADGTCGAEFPLSSAVDLALARDRSWVAGTTALPQDAPWLRGLPGGGERTPPEKGGTGVSCLAASPVENVLAAGAASQSITVWDMDTGRVRETLNGHRKAVTALKFSADGQWLASGSMDESVRLWHPGHPRPPVELGKMRSRLGMGAPRLSADGSLIAASTEDGMLKIFRSATLEVMTGIGLNRWPLGFSPDGRQLVTLTPMGALEEWDTAGGTLLGGTALPVRPYLECVSSLSPDGSTVAVCAGAFLHFLDTRTGRRLFTSGRQGGLILSSAFSPDGRVHATIGQDGLAILREVPSGRELFTLAGHKQDARGLAFSADGRLLATGGHDTHIKIWDTATGRELADMEGHKQVVNFLAFSPDGRTLFSAGDESELFLWHTGDWRSLGRCAIPFPVHSLAVSGDGGTLALTAHPGQLRVLRAPPVPGETGAVSPSSPSSFSLAAGSPATATAPVRPWVLPVGAWPRRVCVIPPRRPETPRNAWI